MKGMAWKNFFKTLDEQIKIIESRGLVIENKKYAKDILLRYNYYKIVNATQKNLVDNKAFIYVINGIGYERYKERLWDFYT